MSFFDTLYCEYPLPDVGLELMHKSFQTNNFNNELDTYTITKEGKLVYHSRELQIVPEEEREFYGKPQWNENKIYRAIGYLKSVQTGDIRLEYSGTLNFYTKYNDLLLNYSATFDKGEIQKITCIKTKTA